MISGRYVTIWDSNTNEPAVQTRRALTAPGDLETPPTFEDVPVRTLARVPVAEREWSRLLWSDAERAAPLAAAGRNFAPGWRILDVLDDIPTVIVGQKLSLDHDGGVADLAAGRITYTWSLVDMGSGEIAAALVARKASMLSALRARFRVVRDQGTTVDFGGGPVPIQTTEAAANDIQRLHDDLRLREAAGAVDPTQDIATANYDIVPGVTIAAAGAMREAVAAHWRATWARDAALGAAINAAADDAALDLIDVQAGTIDGAGGWPT